MTYYQIIGLQLKWTWFTFVLWGLMVRIKPNIISHPAKDGHKLPLTINDWKYMPPHFIENVVLEIKQIFEYPEVLDDWIYTKISDRLRIIGAKNHPPLLPLT